MKKLKRYTLQGKHLSQLIILVTFFSSNVAMPLTLGDFQVSSPLNNKLSGEIPLHLAPNEKPADIVMRTAPANTYEQLKIDRPSFLDNIQFKRIGTTILVSSKDKITLPSVNLLVEVNSPIGTKLHRYKITLNQNALKNKVGSSNVAAIKQQPNTIKEALNTSIKQPTDTVDQIPLNITNKINTFDERFNSDNTFGPIQKNDSLSKISRHLSKSLAMSSQKILTSLRHDNPNAFKKDTHGKLKLGEFLHIPDFNRTDNTSHTKPVQELETTKEPDPIAFNTDILDITIPLIPTTKPIDNVSEQQLQTRVAQLEQNVDQLQKALTLIQTNQPTLITKPNDSQVVTTTTNSNQTQATDNQTISTYAHQKTKHNRPFYPWLILTIAIGLLSALAWIKFRLGKIKSNHSARYVPDENTPSSSKKNTDPLINSFETDLSSTLEPMLKTDKVDTLNTIDNTIVNDIIDLEINLSKAKKTDSYWPLNKKVPTTSANNTKQIDNFEIDFDCLELNPLDEMVSSELETYSSHNLNRQTHITSLEPPNKESAIVAEVKKTTDPIDNLEFDFNFVKIEANNPKTKKSNNSFLPISIVKNTRKK